jgi:hypothetical protein
MHLPKRLGCKMLFPISIFFAITAYQAYKLRKFAKSCLILCRLRSRGFLTHLLAYSGPLLNTFLIFAHLPDERNVCLICSPTTHEIQNWKSKYSLPIYCACVWLIGKLTQPFGFIFVISNSLKVPKCENFHRTDFFYFFTIKPLWVGDFRAKIKNEKF